MTRLEPSATVFFTDVLTAGAFRTFFAWILGFGMVFGAVSKVGIAQRHFQAWSDLEILDLMPLVGTIEFMLITTLLFRKTRVLGLMVVASYQVAWMVASYSINDWPHVFRSAGLLALALLALFYGKASLEAGS